MNIDSIRNGIVLDHIKAGKSMEIYKFLGLDSLDCSVAIIKNAPSHKQGRKDIIKIDSAMELDLNILGFIDPEITVNIIKDGALIEKKHLTLPKQIRDVLKCKNPRCITSATTSARVRIGVMTVTILVVAPKMVTESEIQGMVG